MSELVSVVIATYRRNSFLRKAIESLISQTYPAVEIIVVDDNADREWNDIVSSIVSEFSNIKYICNAANMGSAEARNIGIRNADGMYITFLDDDDIYLPDKIEHQVSAMQKSNADFSLTDLYLYNEDGRLIDKRTRNYMHCHDKDSLLKYHLMYHMTGTDTMMYKKEYLLHIGEFPKIDLGDEFYLMCRAIEGGGHFAYIPGCYVKAFVHTGETGLSSGQSKIDGENALFAYKKTVIQQWDRKTQRYIKMRHHAVLAFAYLRMGSLGKGMIEIWKAVLCSPVNCIKLALSR